MKDRFMKLPTRGVTLFVRMRGDGIPLLLMHGGLGADHSTLLPLLPLSDQFRMVLYDHRCNGRSRGAEVSTLTWENLTADAEALREALGIEKWAVIGNSFGGFVALEYAIRYPKSLSHLVLLDTGGDAKLVQQNAEKVLEERGFSKLAVKTAHRFYNGQTAPGELLKCMFILGKAYYSNQSIGLLIREAFRGLRIRRNAVACIYGYRDLLAGWSVMKQLQSIHNPTLVMAGRDDFQFPPEHQNHLANGIADAQVKIIDGAGHNAHLEKTQEVIGILRHFLGS